MSFLQNNMYKLSYDQHHYCSQLYCCDENLNDILYKSIIKAGLVDFGFIELNPKKEKVLLFKSAPFSTLADLTLSYNDCIMLMDNITNQLHYIHLLGYSIFGFDLHDILSINNKYILCSTDKLLKRKKESILFTVPFSIPSFSSPEILAIEELPCSVTIKTIYYSLGALLVYCLFHINILKGNDFLNEKEIEAILSNLKYTKMYWFLKRCLLNNSEERTLLYI